MIPWFIVVTFLLFLMFATVEIASQVLSRHKVQMLLDAYRQRAAVAGYLLPREAGALRSILSYGRMIGVSLLALALAVFALTADQPLLAAGLIAASIAAAFYLPVILASRNPQVVIKLFLPLVMICNIVLLPLTWPRQKVFEAARARLRQRGADRQEEEDEQEIEAYLDAAKVEGLFDQDEAQLIRQVADFGDTLVREVMTPRIDMVCVDRSATIEEFNRIASEEKFSRYPVIDGNTDSIVGIAHLKALLEPPEGRPPAAVVADIMAPTFFVPESKRVASLLRDLQENKQQMAIVVDEYGGTAGLITLEDILEEIVGEIEDEHDEIEEEEIVKESDGSLVVAGCVDVDEVEKLLGIKLDDESYETVSGLALEHLKRIPAAGESFETKGIRIEILEADEKSILKLRLTKCDGNE